MFIEKKKSIRSANTRSFDVVWELFLKSNGLESKYKQGQIINAWNEVMGNVIASKTDKIYFKEKCLCVTISSAPLRKQLNMSKDKIINNINEYVNHDFLKEIAFF